MANPTDLVSNSKPTLHASSFHRFYRSSMETKPLCPYSFFFDAINVHAKEKYQIFADTKLKNHHSQEEEEDEEEESEVSTEFSLMINTKNLNSMTETSSSCNRKRKHLEINDCFVKESCTKNHHLREEVSNDFLTATMERIASLKNYSPEKEEEERRMGVPTGLKLYEDPWKIRKGLKESDIGGLSRLLLAKESVQTYIIPMLGPVREREIESNEGTRVSIWDYDTESEHQLTLKRWPTTKSYVLIGNWRQQFVNRRDLKLGDEIGLLWDRYSSRFGFRVLVRAPGN